MFRSLHKEAAKVKAAHLIVLFLIATSFVGTTIATTIEGIERGLRQRFEALDRVAVDFSVNVYRFDDHLDPWDKDNWVKLSDRSDGLCLDLRGRLKLLAPVSFLLDVEKDCSDEERVDRYSWHEKELRVLGGIGTPELGGLIKPEHTSGLLLTDHALTPVGFRFFEREENLLQMMQLFSMTVMRDNDDGVLLRGEELFSGGKQVAEFSLSVDQGFLMTDARYAAFMEHEQEYKKVYEFVYRLMETSEFDGLVVPKRACYYLHSPIGEPHFTLREWLLESIAKDESIDTDTIVLDFPAGTRVVDLIRRKSWFVGDDGERLDEEPIPDNMEARAQADIDAHVAVEELRARRRGILPYIGFGAVAVTVVFVVFRRSRV
jgi:hypothetical protein